MSPTLQQLIDGLAMRNLCPVISAVVEVECRILVIGSA